MVAGDMKHRSDAIRSLTYPYLVQWAGSNDEYSLFLERELIAILCTKLFELMQLNNAMATVMLNVFNIVSLGGFVRFETEPVGWQRAGTLLFSFSSKFTTCLFLVSFGLDLSEVGIFRFFLLLFLAIKAFMSLKW